AELDAVKLRGRRHPRPVRVAAAPRGVEVADVDSARLEHVAAAARRVLALAGADRDAAARTHLAHVAAVVRPDAGLLEPADVQVGDARAKVERLANRVALVGVDRDHEVVAGGLPRGPDAGRVFLGGERADLELAALEAQLAPLGHLVADPAEIAPVVAADDVDRNPVPVPAPELP